MVNLGAEKEVLEVPFAETALFLSRVRLLMKMGAKRSLISEPPMPL